MTVDFDELFLADLMAGQVYRGGDQPHVGFDPISNPPTVGKMGDSG